MKRIVPGLIAFCGTCWAQGVLPDQLNVLGSHRGGVHLYGVSVYSAYNSSPLPFTTFQRPGGTGMGHEIGYGLSTSLGWTHSGQMSNVSMSYSLGYSGRVRYSDWNSLNHNFSFAASRRLAPKWEAHLSAGGAVRNIEHYLFSPMVIGQIVDVPATFDDLANAVAAGKYTNEQLASLLTGAPLVESPAQTFLFGDRVMIGALQAGATYSRSQRMTVSVSMGVNRLQQLDSGLAKSTGQPVLLNHATSGAAGVGISYSLSPRTQVGVEAATHHVFSSLTNTYGTTVSGNIGHLMGRRWFVTGRVGVSLITHLRDQPGPPSRPHYVLGGSLGLKLARHTFMATHDRSFSDLYGLGAAYTMTTSGAWHWNAGRGWTISSAAGRQTVGGSRVGDVSGIHASASAGRPLSRMLTLSFGFSYMQNSLRTAGMPYSGSFYSAMVSVSWRPAFN